MQTSQNAAARIDRHRFMLGLACAVIAASLAMEVLPSQQVAVRGLTAFPLPALCLSQQIAGVECPGCGLTRSFIHLAHGDFQASWRMHHLGWLLALALCAQVPYRAYCLGRGSYGLTDRLSRPFGWSLIGLLLLHGFVRALWQL